LLRGEIIVPLPLNSYAASRADFYLGTAAIASWLSGLAGPNQSGASSAPSTQTPTPNIIVSGGANSFAKFRSQVSAATTANGSNSDSQQDQLDGQDGPMNAIAAYSDS
jgi:hypothetical protein